MDCRLSVIGLQHNCLQLLHNVIHNLRKTLICIDSNSDGEESIDEEVERILILTICPPVSEHDVHVQALQMDINPLQDSNFYGTDLYGRCQNKLPVYVSYSAVKMLLNGSCRRHSVFTVRA